MDIPNTIHQPVAITIAGSDSGGGAGIQADLKTFFARKVHGVSAITCLTAQNPDSVTRVSPVEPDFLREQLEQIRRFFPIQAAKTGMLFSAPLIREVGRFIRENRSMPTVVDPVMVATSGAVLLEPEAITALREEVLPHAALITPNLDEAAVLLGGKLKVADEMKDAATTLSKMFGVPVLLKGGHLDDEFLIDVLVVPGKLLQVFEDARIHKVDTHGSGCTLSAAIAAELAKGAPLPEAVATARLYLRRAMTQAITIAGRAFIHHSPID